MRFQAAWATELIAFQMVLKKAEMAFHTVFAALKIAWWQWFHSAMSSPMGGRKMIRRRGHHFLKNPAMAFHTVLVMVCSQCHAWTIGSVTVCHADSKKSA